MPNDVGGWFFVLSALLPCLGSIFLPFFFLPPFFFLLFVNTPVVVGFVPGVIFPLASYFRFFLGFG
jgi:hypothetical protein